MYFPPEPYLQIRNNSIVLYSLCQQTGGQKHSLQQYETYQGKVSNSAKKRMTKAIDIMLQCSQWRWIHNPVSGRMQNHRLSFVTLTIPGKERHIDAREGNKQILQPFLKKCRDKKMLSTYVWKAEYQQNGQLHYHLTTPSFLHWSVLRNNWNNTLASASLLKKWYEERGNYDPNSTDIHSVYKIKDVGAYLTKYFTKKDQDSDSKGKIWGASSNLLKAKYFSIPVPLILNDIYEVKEAKVLDQCVIVPCDNPKEFLPNRYQIQYDQFIESIKSDDFTTPAAGFHK